MDQGSNRHTSDAYMQTSRAARNSHRQVHLPLPPEQASCQRIPSCKDGATFQHRRGHRTGSQWALNTLGIKQRSVITSKDSQLVVLVDLQLLLCTLRKGNAMLSCKQIHSSVQSALPCFTAELTCIRLGQRKLLCGHQNT